MEAYWNPMTFDKLHAGRAAQQSGWWRMVVGTCRGGGDYGCMAVIEAAGAGLGRRWHSGLGSYMNFGRRAEAHESSGRNEG